MSVIMMLFSVTHKISCLMNEILILKRQSTFILHSGIGNQLYPNYNENHVCEFFFSISIPYYTTTIL